MASNNDSWKKMTALLIVGVGAADAEYTRVFEHWNFLLGLSRAFVVFESCAKTGVLKARIKKVKYLKPEQPYFITEVLTGTFLGIISKGIVRPFQNCTPVSGRAYQLIPMAEA